MAEGDIDGVVIGVDLLDAGYLGNEIDDALAGLLERPPAREMDLCVADGDLGDVMDMIIDSGLDAVMAIQPFCGMDIKQLKHDYGSRITLWGNINISDLLIFGSPEEVRTVVKETIRIAAPGGRFILSTSNSPAIPDIPTENLLAMYEAAKEYGEYPVDYKVTTENYRKYIKRWR